MEKPLITKEKEGEAEKKSSASSFLSKFSVILVVVAACASIWWFWGTISGCLADFMSVIEGWGFCSIPIIMACCALSTATCAPIIYFFELAAGAIFYHLAHNDLIMGLVYACAAVMPGVYFGSLVAFSLGRKFLKPVVESLMKENASLTIVNEIVAEEGWKFAMLLGLNPAIPFELLNYALSMSDLSFSHFALSSLGVMPVVAFEVYGGVCAAAVANSMQGKSESSVWEPIIQYSIAGVLILGMAYHAKNKFNTKAQQRSNDHQMTLNPAFLGAVGKFKESLNKHRSEMAQPQERRESDFDALSMQMTKSLMSFRIAVHLISSVGKGSSNNRKQVSPM